MPERSSSSPSPCASERAVRRRCLGLVSAVHREAGEVAFPDELFRRRTRRGDAPARRRGNRRWTPPRHRPRGGGCRRSPRSWGPSRLVSVCGWGESGRSLRELVCRRRSHVTRRAPGRARALVIVRRARRSSITVVTAFSGDRLSCVTYDSFCLVNKHFPAAIFLVPRPEPRRSIAPPPRTPGRVTPDRARVVRRARPRLRARGVARRGVRADHVIDRGADGTRGAGAESDIIIGRAVRRRLD